MHTLYPFTEIYRDLIGLLCPNNFAIYKYKVIILKSFSFIQGFSGTTYIVICTTAVQYSSLYNCCTIYIQ